MPYAKNQLHVTNYRSMNRMLMTIGGLAGPPCSLSVSFLYTSRLREDPSGSEAGNDLHTMRLPSKTSQTQAGPKPLALSAAEKFLPFPKADGTELRLVEWVLTSL